MLTTLRKYLRVEAFDTSTEAGRTLERYRLAAWAILANFVSKGAALAVMVLSVSLTIPYLGAQRFGIWMTIASLAGLLSFLGMGVGNALTNHVAVRSAQRDPALLRQAISGGLGFLLVIGLAVGISLFLVAGWLPWAALIKVDDTVHLHEARDAAKLFAVLFGLSLFTSGIQSVFAGLQQTYEVYFASTIGSVLAIGCLWVCVKAQAGIPLLLASTLGVQSLSTLILMVVLVKRELFSLSEIKFSIKQEACGLIRIGGLFFALQIGTMIGWGADALIISSSLGPAQVAIYSITQRLFQFVSQPLTIFNLPLWGAYADAYSKGDVGFILRTLRASMLMTFFGALLGAVLLFAGGERLLSYWTHGNLEVPILLIGLVALWTVVECCGGAFAMFLNGVQVIGQQVVVVIVFCLLVLPLKLIGVEHLGLIAIPMATIGAYLLTHIFFYGFIFFPRIRSLVSNSS